VVFAVWAIGGRQSGWLSIEPYATVPHIMLDTVQASLIDVAERRGQGSFRATVTDHLPVSFLCAFRGDDGGRAIAADPLTRASTALPPGRYLVDIDVICGQRLFSHRQEMTVGERSIFTYWYRI
jgi:hypothetical protein